MCLVLRTAWSGVKRDVGWLISRAQGTGSPGREFTPRKSSKYGARRLWISAGAIGRRHGRIYAAFFSSDRTLCVTAGAPVGAFQAPARRRRRLASGLHCTSTGIPSVSPLRRWTREMWDAIIPGIRQALGVSRSPDRTRSVVRVARKPIVYVFTDAVMQLSALPRRVDMHVHASEVLDVMEKLMPHLAGDGVSLADR